MKGSRAGVQPYDVKMDPADIPNPSDETMARMRENRRQRSTKANAA